MNLIKLRVANNVSNFQFFFLYKLRHHFSNWVVDLIFNFCSSKNKIYPTQAIIKIDLVSFGREGYMRSCCEKRSLKKTANTVRLYPKLGYFFYQWLSLEENFRTYSCFLDRMSNISHIPHKWKFRLSLISWITK